MVDSCHFKNLKNRNVSTMYWPVLMKFNMAPISAMCHPCVVKNLKITLCVT